MAAYQVLLLNTAVPQIQAAQSGDTYVVPRDIAFSAALTLSAGTANGVPYLNGSKVLTTGSALTFDGTNFSVAPDANRSLKVQPTGTFSMLLENPSVDSGASIQFKTNGTFLWSRGASDAMALTSTGLGIGTSSPATKLHVAGEQLIQPTTVANAKLSMRHGSIGNNNYFEVDSSSNTIFGTANAERARITSGGNFKIGGSADRATTEGDKQLVLFDGTAPVGTLANGVSFYSASGEANVMDAAGNATLLSPHDAVTNEWIFRSKHTPTGKVLKIDVERLLKFVNDHFGLDAVHEFIED